MVKSTQAARLKCSDSVTDDEYAVQKRLKSASTLATDYALFFVNFMSSIQRARSSCSSTSNGFCEPKRTTHGLLRVAFRFFLVKTTRIQFLDPIGTQYLARSRHHANVRPVLFLCLSSGGRMFGGPYFVDASGGVFVWFLWPVLTGVYLLCFAASSVSFLHLFLPYFRRQWSSNGPCGGSESDGAGGFG